MEGRDRARQRAASLSNSKLVQDSVASDHMHVRQASTALRADDRSLFCIIADGREVSALCLHAPRSRAHIESNNKKHKNDLPPTGALWDAAWDDGAKRLRELVLGRSSRLQVGAHAMQIKEEEVTLYRHVQLPERITRGPSEKRLQREQSIPANPRRLGGGRFGVDAARAVGVSAREHYRSVKL